MKYALGPGTALIVLLCSGCGDEDAGDAGFGSDNPKGVVATLRVVDAESGARYDALGRGLDGQDNLVPFVGYNQFWFSWSVFNHDSEVFESSSRVQTGNIEASGECAVPCDQIRLGCDGTDCIPSLTNPSAVSASDEEAEYVSDNSFVVGVSRGGQSRAYPHNVLWWHEVVNDEVGGEPLAVTHCPLTFSSIVHDRRAFVEGKTVELGVSGRLYNSNLVFYDRSDGTWFSQLLGVGTKGPALAAEAPRVPSFEMTWAAWRTLNPETTVLAETTGFARDYQEYPYDDYFFDDDDTFMVNRPSPDSSFPAKSPTYGVRLGGEAKAYVHSSLSTWAQAQYGADAPPAGVVMDEVGGIEVAIVFDIDAGYVQAFDRTGLGELELALE